MFATKEPGKWAAAVQAFAKMAGYSDKQEVTHEHKLSIEVTHMSDAQLLDAIAELQESIRDASPPLGLRRSRSVPDA